MFKKLESQILPGQYSDLTRKLLDVVCQATYTGRSLGGILTPRKSLSTDMRDVSKEAYEQALKVTATKNNG
jgi:hypothetical protein